MELITILFFYNVDIVFHIEGKSSSDGITYDELFYSTIFSYILTGKTFKVKPVGSCYDVDEIYRKKLDCRRSAVVFDRDIYGLSSSYLNKEGVVYTKGYSWENDFWNKKLIINFFKNNTTLNVDEVFVGELERCFGFLTNRLKKVFVLEVASNLSGRTLFKEKKTGVLGFSASDCPLIMRAKSYKIYSDKFRSLNIGCSVLCDFLEYINDKDYNLIVNGHIWESAILRFLSNIYKNKTKKNFGNHDFVKELIFSQFRNNVTDFVEPDVIEHYRSHLSYLVD